MGHHACHLKWVSNLFWKLLGSFRIAFTTLRVKFQDVDCTGQWILAKKLEPHSVMIVKITLTYWMLIKYQTLFCINSFNPQNNPMKYVLYYLYFRRRTLRHDDSK